MKGVYNKRAIRAIVEPLKTLTSVFNGKPLHVVYETEEDGIYIGVVNGTKSVYAMYRLDANEVIEDYEAMGEIGIYDVKQFINILGKYEDEIYAENVIIEKPTKNKLVITCGKEVTDFYLSDLYLFEACRFTKRKINTSSLTESVKFTLDGVMLKKLIANMNVFAEQDIITLSGQEGGDCVSVRLSCSSNSVSNKNESKIDGLSVATDFDMKFNKSEIKGLLSKNDTFNVTVFTSEKKRVVQVGYETDGAELTCILNEIDVD